MVPVVMDHRQAVALGRLVRDADPVLVEVANQRYDSGITVEMIGGPEGQPTSHTIDHAGRVTTYGEST